MNRGLRAETLVVPVTVTCPWIYAPVIASRMVWFNCITAFGNNLDARESAWRRPFLAHAVVN